LGNCEFCGKDIGYLPFKCKYCGLTLCGKHRLPENHECSFMLKANLVVPTTSRDSAPIYRNRAVEVSIRDYKQDKETKRFEKKIYMSRYSRKGGFYLTNYLLFTILGVSLAALYSPKIVCLSLYNLLQFPDYYWIFITSLFTATSAIITFSFFYVPDIYDFIIFIFMVILFYRIFKNVETYHGKDFLFLAFIFSAFFTCFFAIIYRIILEVYYPINYNTIICYGFAIGGLYGVISFFIFNNKSEDVELIGDIKVNKNLILITLVILRIFPWLIAGVVYYAGFFLFIPDLAGILAGYIIYLFKREKEIDKN